MTDISETIQERINRYAFNRYEIRKEFKAWVNDTAADDYRVAEEIVRKEEQWLTSKT